jgi:hypothetical protein
MNEASADPAVLPGKGFSGQKFLFLITLAFAVHLTLIFAFGSKKPPAVRPVENVPHLQLADDADDLVALDNPALFALPNPRDFSSAIWLKTPDVPPPTFRYTEDLRYLAPDVKNLGALFKNFMQTNPPGAFQFHARPNPQWASPVLSGEPALPVNSTLQIRGELAQRPLLRQPVLPSLPFNDIIAPSPVQVLVDPSGNVVSAVLLPSDNPLEALGRADIGDTNALAFALGLRFAPAAEPAFGEVIFNWHIIPIPLASTNAP